MANCKACGAWFASSCGDELCISCEKALKRLGDYVAPVVHGRWIMDGKEHCYCSECKHRRNIRTQIGWAFCPNCGAKMDKEAFDELDTP